MHHGAGWQTYMAGLAFTIALSGLGWAECGNDYTRYLPPDTSKKAIVGWVFLGTAVPEILVMTLGAVVGTFFLASVGASASAFLPFAHQSAIPAWFVVVFLLFAMVQLFAINSLDLYSSGVTLQALGVKVKRYQAVIIDSVICLGVTMLRHLRLLVHDLPRRTSSTSSSSGSPHGSPSSWSTGACGAGATYRASSRHGADGALLEHGRRPLAGHRRPGGGDGRRHFGPVGDVLGSPLAERDHVPQRTAPTSASSPGWPPGDAVYCRPGPRQAGTGSGQPGRAAHGNEGSLPARGPGGRSVPVFESRPPEDRGGTAACRRGHDQGRVLAQRASTPVPSVIWSR